MLFLYSVLRALNRARCRRFGRCGSFLVSYWIISICRPIGVHITLSTYTCHTSPLFETLSPGCFYFYLSGRQLASILHCRKSRVDFCFIERSVDGMKFQGAELFIYLFVYILTCLWFPDIFWDILQKFPG